MKILNVLWDGVHLGDHGGHSRTGTPTLQDLVHVTQAAAAGAWRATSHSKQGVGAEGPRSAGHQRVEEAVT